MLTTIKKLFGREAASDAADERRDPTQRCESCGEEYYTESDVATCNSCGGVKIQRV